ncbi:MAG: FecR domain-containing protein [Candidatus Brocadiia bacterium]
MIQSDPNSIEQRLSAIRLKVSAKLDERVERLTQEMDMVGGHDAVEHVAVPRPASGRRLVPFGLAAAGVLLGVAMVLVIQLGQRRLGLAHQIPIRISAIQGAVLVKHVGTAAWEELSVASALRVGDQLWTGSASSINLTLKDNSLVTLNAGGVLSIKHHDGRVEFELTHGTMRAILREGHPPFFVRTPQGRLEALGTDFTVSVK